jgi:hypothetical protein
LYPSPAAAPAGPPMIQFVSLDRLRVRIREPQPKKTITPRRHEEHEVNFRLADIQTLRGLRELRGENVFRQVLHP